MACRNAFLDIYFFAHLKGGCGPGLPLGLYLNLYFNLCTGAHEVQFKTHQLFSLWVWVCRSQQPLKWWEDENTVKKRGRNYLSTHCWVVIKNANGRKRKRRKGGGAGGWSGGGWWLDGGSHDYPEGLDMPLSSSDGGKLSGSNMWNWHAGLPLDLSLLWNTLIPSSWHAQRHERMSVSIHHDTL